MYSSFVVRYVFYISFWGYLHIWILVTFICSGLWGGYLEDDIFAMIWAIWKGRNARSFIMTYLMRLSVFKFFVLICHGGLTESVALVIEIVKCLEWGGSTFKYINQDRLEVLLIPLNFLKVPLRLTLTVLFWKDWAKVVLEISFITWRALYCYSSTR